MQITPEASEPLKALFFGQVFVTKFLQNEMWTITHQRLSSALKQNQAKLSSAVEEINLNAVK
jgi:hypothetical protein